MGAYALNTNIKNALDAGFNVLVSLVLPNNKSLLLHLAPCIVISHLNNFSPHKTVNLTIEWIQ